MFRLLVIAPTCDGEDVGEAWLAFQWVKRLANQHHVTLLTYHKRDRTLASQQLKGVRVIEWGEPPLLGKAERFNSMLNPGYIPFFFRARRWLKTALRAGETFDICHQITPVAIRYPSPAVGLPLPLVMGPVGGSLQSPEGFKTTETSAPWFVRLRSLDKFRLKHDPLLRSTYTSAACVLGIASYVQDHLDGIPVKRFEIMSETGIEALPHLVPRAPNRELKLLYVGRLVRTKGARDAIQAMAQLSDLNATLDIVGDGPDRGECERLTSEFQLGDRVVFHGAIPRHQVDDYYRRADVFVFPSYREPGGNVIFEAMSYQLPLVVVDRGGPSSMVDAHCAELLQAVNPEALARDVAGAIRKLAGDPGIRLKMGEAARERVWQIANWDSKVERMNEIYASIV